MANAVGKDKVVKYWDMDRFELLLALEGHQADIWCLAVSHLGDFVITGASHRPCAARRGAPCDD